MLSTYKTSVHLLTHFAFLIYKLVLSFFAYHPLLNCIISFSFFFAFLPTCLPTCLPTYLPFLPFPPSLFLLSFVLRYCAQTLLVLVVILLTLYFLFVSFSSSIHRIHLSLYHSPFLLCSYKRALVICVLVKCAPHPNIDPEPPFCLFFFFLPRRNWHNQGKAANKADKQQHQQRNNAATQQLHAPICIKHFVHELRIPFLAFFCLLSTRRKSLPWLERSPSKALNKEGAHSYSTTGLSPFPSAFLPSFTPYFRTKGSLPPIKLPYLIFLYLHLSSASLVLVPSLSTFDHPPPSFLLLSFLPFLPFLGHLASSLNGSSLVSTFSSRFCTP